MIDQFYKDPAVVKRLRTCLLGSHFDHFFEFISGLGYSKRTVRNQLWILSAFSEWLEDNGLGVDDLETHFADLIADPVETNRKLNLLWISAGEKESARVKRFLDFLTAHHIQHEFHLMPGEHTFINWRRCLHRYAQQLFRP